MELKASFNAGLFSIAKKMVDDNPSASRFIFIIYGDETHPLPDLNLYSILPSPNVEIVYLNSFIESHEELKKALEQIAEQQSTYEWEKERNRRIIKAKQDVQWRNISLFLGVGVSMSMEMPSWNKLLEHLLEQPHHNPDMPHIKGSDIDSINEACGHSSIIAGRYVTLGLSDVEKSIRDVFYKNPPTTPSPLVDSICKAFKKDCVKSIITYNYDDLIEETLSQMKIDYATIAEHDYSYTSSKPIYHVHGYIPRKENQPSFAVLSEERYHDIYREAYHWSNVEQLHTLSRNVCFFIGLSMTDPNLRRLCDIAMRNRNTRSIEVTCANTDNTPEPIHYAFLKRNSFKKGCDNCPDCPKNTEHFDIFEHMMNDLGIQVIWVTDFDKELPKLVKEIFNV